MHILSVLTSLTSGGAEMLVVNLSEEYVAKGHRSTVVTLVDAESVGNSPQMEAKLRRRILDEGGEVRSLQLGAKRNPVVGWLRMQRLLARMEPDIVHAHTARALLMLASFSHSNPVVLTHHNSHLSFPGPMFYLIDHIADAFIAISKETEAIFARHVHGPIAHIPNAASKSFAVAQARTAIGHSRQILSVGTISDQKHYDLLIDTASELAGRLPQSAMPKFLVAGGGAGLEGMRANVRQKQLDEHVDFLGERTDIAELMAMSDLYLNTSRYEGMPVALLEAMACGLPIVATQVAGNCELVVPETNGLLCPLDDPPAIADAIVRLMSDPVLYARCSQGSVDMSAMFSVEATAQAHLELFERLAQPR